jgi:hypothetical protein
VIAVYTVLRGALRRAEYGLWEWTDTGDPEPAVRDLTLADLAPSWRCTRRGGRTFVEIPGDWERDVQDADVRQAVRELLQTSGVCAEIYAEGLAELLGCHRTTVPGWLVPAESWNARMSEVVGAQWQRADEPRILARAEQVRRNTRRKEGP